MVLKHKEGSEDGFGIHLSGGLPPVTITYVEPRGEADLQGVKVGDVVLDVNGLNCRKKVDITQLMQLKMLVQQTPAKKTTTKQDHLDVSFRKRYSCKSIPQDYNYHYGHLRLCVWSSPQ